MVTKLLTKVGVSGGVLVGSMFSIEPSIMNNEEVGEAPRITESKINASEIKTLVDVELFAKQNKCTFTFVNSWGSKQVSRAEDFIGEATKQEKHKSTDKDHWTGLIIEAVKKEENKCKENKVLVFFSPKSNEKILELRAP